MKTVYACFTTDIIHAGHLNIIREAQKYGQLTIGVMSDEALVRFDRFPTKTLEERLAMVRCLDGVSNVIVQDSVMYDKVIAELKPDYVIHGDNWLEGPTKAIRDNVQKALSSYGGTIVDVPYTRNELVHHMDERVKAQLAMPEFRRARLRRMLSLRPVVKAIEVHSGLTGLLAEKTVVEHDGELDQFDAMWISSLCDSTAKGKPDIELVDMTSRFRTIDDVMEVTTKPLSNILSTRCALWNAWAFRPLSSKTKRDLRKIRFSEPKSSKRKIRLSTFRKRLPRAKRYNLPMTL